MSHGNAIWSDMTTRSLVYFLCGYGVNDVTPGINTHTHRWRVAGNACERKVFPTFLSLLIKEYLRKESGFCRRS